MNEVSQDIANLTPEQLELLQLRMRRLKKKHGDGRSKIVRQSRESNVFPMSFPQQLLFFLDQLEPGSTAYTIPIAYRLRGELDAEALERSLAEVVRRHEILRTTFAVVDDRPAQILAAEAAVPLAVVEVPGASRDEREKRARGLIEEGLAEPFDLGAGPMLRARLLRLGAREHILFLAVHHIVADAWGTALLIQEIAEQYRSRSAGVGAPAEDLAIQYADFACWQHQQLEGARGEALAAYWKDRLAGVPPVFELPTDHPRPRVQSFRVGARELALPADLTEALRQASRRHDATLFMVLLAGFKALLARYCERHDVFVGSPISNRELASVQKLIGCFGNILVLRTDLSGDPAFPELLERVQRTALGAFDHDQLPFDRLVRALDLERSSSYIPLLQAMFNLQKQVADLGLALPGLEAEVLDFDIGTIHDLDLMVIDGERELIATLKYNRDLFEDQTAGALLEAWAGILGRWVREPQARLSELDLPPDLAGKAREAELRDRQRTIAVAATFTAEPVVDSLSFWTEALDLPFEIELAPYHQVFQQLLDPAGLLAGNAAGVNVVLVRFEDWQSHRESGASAAPALERNVADLLAALRTAAGRGGAPHLVFLLPPSPAAGARAAWRQVEERVRGELRDVDGVHVITSGELAELYPVASPHDPHADELGHVPFTLTFYAALGTMIARRVLALTRAPRKVVALDADGTLWKGVCAEDGPEGVEVDAGSRALQELLLAQHDAGVLLCVVSKNELADVEAAFDRCPGMVLRREHVAAWRVDWRPKSESLRSLAEELRLGLDSFVFVDDSPVECAEVGAHCPQVLTLELPPEREHFGRFLEHVWELDHLRVTDEDRRRTALYRQDRRRRQLADEALSFADFLDGLELEVDLEPIAGSQRARVSQLTRRTNQFNATTVRRSEAELGRFLSSAGAGGLAVTVRDRFGDYGLVGAVLWTRGADALEVDTFLLSCRALGRGVEFRMLARLGELAAGLELGEVRIPWVPTTRNRPVRDFLEGLEAGARSPSGAGFVVSLDAAAAAALRFRPGGERRESFEEAPPAASAAAAAGVDSERSRRVAGELYDAERILAAIGERQRELGSVRGSGGDAPAGTPTERRLSELWQQLLSVDEVGAHDNFFKLGGHSLLGTIMLSRVRDAFQVELPLYSLFEAPTVASFAQKIHLAQIEQASAEELQDLMGELGDLSDDEVRALLAEEG